MTTVAVADSTASAANVSGLVVAITGAASGIGAGLAARFAAEGALVSGCDTSAASVRTAHSAAVDVTNPAAVESWFADVVARYGRLDAVVANAGIARRVSLEDAEWPDIEDVMRVNVYGVLHTFRAAIPHLRAQGGGRLVALVSRNAELCPAGLIGYNMSKAAVIAAVRTLARELKGSGIVVNGLIPGPSRSGMNPEGTREPDSCYPTARMLCTMAGDGPSGRSFFDGTDYPFYSRFS